MKKLDEQRRITNGHWAIGNTDFMSIWYFRRVTGKGKQLQHLTKAQSAKLRTMDLKREPFLIPNELHPGEMVYAFSMLDLCQLYGFVANE